MAVDKRIEVELALRDTVSLTLKAVADNLDKINKSLAGDKEGKAAADDPFKKIKEATEGARKTSEEGAKEATAAGERLIPISAGLMRGLAARATVILTIGKMLSDAMLGNSRYRLQMRDMARDTGFTEGFISIVRQAFGRGGVEREQALAGIQKMGGLIDEMARGPGGKLSRQLIAVGEGGLALGMEKLAQAGQRDDALKLAFQRAAELDKNPEQLIRLAKAFDSSPSFFKDVFKNMQGLQPEFLESLEGTKHWVKDILDIYITTENLIKMLSYGSVVAINRGLDIGGFTWDIWKNALTTNPYVRSALGLPALTAAELEDYKKRNETTLRLMQEILSSLQGVQNKQSIEKREAGGTVLPGRMYEVAEKGPEAFRDSTGWLEMLEPKKQGPRFFIPKRGGEIIPGDPFKDMEEKWSRRNPREMPDPDTWFTNRFGQWPGYEHTPEGFMQQPYAPPGGTPEQNWEALNKALQGPFSGVAGGLGWREGEAIGRGESECDAC